MTRLSYNTAILLVNNILSAGLVLLLTIVIVRGLGDASFGRYATIMAWVLPLTLVADFGMNTLITRDVAQSPASAYRYLHITHRWRLLVGGVVIGGVWLAAPLLSQDVLIIAGLRIAIWLALIDSYFGSYTAVFRAWEIFWPILVLNSLYLSLQIVGAMAVVLNGGTVVGLMMVLVIADGLQLLLTWLLWQRYIRHRHRHTTSSMSITRRGLFRRAAPFVIAGVLAMLQMRVMIIVLDQLVLAEAVGWYAAAFRLLEAARMAPNALFVALFPRLSALVEDQQAFSALMQRAAWGLILYSIVVGVAATFGGEAVIVLLFGQEFAPSQPVLAVLVWSLLPGNLRALLTLYHYAHGHENIVNVALFVGLLLQVTAGVLLVPLYGLASAGWAVIIGESSLVVCLGLMLYIKTKQSDEPS